MPVMDGYEFVRQLRLDPATSAIPVVFYTAHYGEREARALALSSGVCLCPDQTRRVRRVLRIVGRVLSGDSEAGARRTPRRHAGVRPRAPSAAHRQALGKGRRPESRERAIERADQYRPGARVRARLRPAAADVCVAARDLFGATYVTLGILDRDDQTVQRFVDLRARTPPTGSRPATRSRFSARSLPSGERARRQSRRRSGQPAASAAPSGSSRVPGRADRVTGARLRLDLSGRQRGTRLHRRRRTSGHGAVGSGRPHLRVDHEILERKQAESALRHERDRAQRYLDTAEVILLALDRRGESP